MTVEEIKQIMAIVEAVVERRISCFNPLSMCHDMITALLNLMVKEIESELLHRSLAQLEDKLK